MTIRLRTTSGDELRIRPQLEIYPASYEGGLGPYNLNSNAGAGPVVTELLYDRFDAVIQDRFNADIETRT